MSTRACIAIQTGPRNQFSGTYHHYDGYPTSLGRALWTLYHGHFKGDLNKMVATLLAHSWSTIQPGGTLDSVGDFNQEPGFIEYDNPLHEDKSNPEHYRPRCYCHGDRNEQPWAITNTEDAWDIDWFYVFNTRTKCMRILVGNKDKFKCVKSIKLDGDEPDWEAI